MVSTRVAVLGTLMEFHQEALPYDPTALVGLVTDMQPDLLCLDLAPEQWQAQDFGGLPPEYRDALLPLAYQTDIVVVPIGGADPPVVPAAPGWRGWLIRLLRQGLTLIQRTAPDLDAINHGLRHDLSNHLYDVAVQLAANDVEQWRAKHIEYLTGQVLSAARRDPGTRILVVVNVQYCHHIRPRLREYPEIDVVKFDEL